ncbi:bifunctional 2-polyprenyl-6-hydroxyphenol methylase/3-demethylubiquinol 3-O-methyltransferase UbiG [Methanobrevibacter millerae]|uniref:SAM-dependent methyltransferase n=1 Tax=Methanobrevibacter millerae TaxID=230361 RepID=A0A0U2TT15_9EURY|nr:class I SAM-dependent methyltransferase [Methanobrevibacter millerae]ALT69011.1 SAM-dependent methyltransferase [Methanobrevibacter millerae]
MNNFYDDNAEEFFKGTVNVDISYLYDDFLSLIPDNGNILDAGCGSGRDSKFFISKNYNVTSIDGSYEMCRVAGEYLEREVMHMQFQEMEFENEFDGIWALASLLHVPSDEIKDVLKRFKNALKENGVIYASFKYGEFEGERNGRYFNDMDEKSSNELFEKLGFEIIKTWTTQDARKDREDEKWLNIIVKKINF